MRDWIKAELRRQKKTQAGLAKALGRDKSVVSKMLQGKRRILASDIEKISAFLGGRPVPSTGAIAPRTERVQPVTVTGGLAVGTWRERDLEPAIGTHFVPWVPDPAYFGMQQYARLVETSHSPHVERGDYAIFVSFSALNRPPQDRDLVHCARVQNGLEEHTLRRVVRHDGQMHLVLEHEPQASPAVIWSPSSRSVRILGLFLGAFRPPRMDMQRR